jgi:hypothetical protein
LPENSWINYVAWSLDSKYISFTIRSPGGPRDPPREPLQLWLAEVSSGKAQIILDRRLNTIFDKWVARSEQVLMIDLEPNLKVGI